MSTRLMNRTERLSAIEQMLFRSTMGLRAVEIAETCGVDRRTVYRDLTLLTEVGVPIEQKDGRFLLNRENYSASIRLNFDEVLALFLAARVMSRRSDAYSPHLTPALHKLRAALPEPVAAHIALTLDMLNETQVDPRFAHTLETMGRAWSEQRKIKLWYGDEDEPKLCEFSIYCLEPTPLGVLHAVGFDSHAQRVRVIDVRSVRRIKLLQSTFQTPARFDARRYIAGLWGSVGSDMDERMNVVLVFHADVAASIASSLSRAAQRLEPVGDKRYKLTVQVYDWREMLPWIRSWGARVEVLEPQALRDEVAADAIQVVSVYGARV